jgi:rod shape-determining protein MreD
MRILFPVALLLAFVMEPVIGAHFHILGGRPLLILGLVVYFALVRGAPAGAFFGWMIGFLCDMTGIHNMGLKTLTFSVVGFGVGNTLDSVYKDNAWTQATILFLAVLLHESLSYLVVTRLDIGGYLPYTVRVALPTALVTAAAFPLLLSGFERMTRKEISFDARRVVIRRRRR